MSYLNNYLFNIMAIIVTSSFKRDIKRRYLELVTAEWAEVLECIRFAHTF